MIVYPALLFSRIALFPHCSFPALLFSRIALFPTSNSLHIEWELHYKVFERVSSQSLDPHLPVVPETRSSSVLFLKPRFRQRLERNRKPSGENPRPHRCNTDGLRPPTNRVAACSVQMGFAVADAVPGDLKALG